MNIIEVTKNNFEEVTKRELVLLDFWAVWCSPCRMLTPVLEELAKENANLTIGKINVDEEQELANMFNIMSIPTVIVYKNGVRGVTSLGYKDKSAFLEMIK